MKAPADGHATETNGLFTRPWRMWLSFVDNVVNGIQYAAVSSYQTPLTGFSIQAPSNASKLVLTPAGVLATGTVTMPATPSEGFEFRLLSTQIVTALTLTPGPGQTIKNAVSTLAAGVGVGYTYSTSTSTWYRLY
jgi:hypothetical protein